MSNNNVQTMTEELIQLRAELEKLQQANNEKLKIETELRSVKSLIKLQTNPSLIEAKTKLAVKASNTKKLQDLVQTCANIIQAFPIHNAKTRTNRVWAPNHKYGYGEQIDLTYQLASGITYACEEHRNLMLAETNLDQELLNQILDGFGTPTYYSRINHVVVEEKPYNYNNLQGALTVFQSQLNVVIDTSKVTERNLEYEFTKAVVTAQSNFNKAQEALNEADFEL